MPYRLKGNTVEVSRPQGWVKVKTHRSKEMAKKHLAALKKSHLYGRKR
tara:strand:+ start:416 stop:559 length:144 start_codon:yes stop_codon:yes gene_type:complete